MHTMTNTAIIAALLIAAQTALFAPFLLLLLWCPCPQRSRLLINSDSSRCRKRHFILRLAAFAARPKATPMPP